LRLTLGELRLKEYYGLPDETRRNETNLVSQARAQFEQIIANTNTQLVAKAQLDRGWCLWEEGQARADTNRISGGLLAFKAASEQLPRSEEQAVARFKLADCQFAVADYGGALTNYWRVATNYPDLPRVRSDLVGQAYYQIVRASIPSGELTGAGLAVQKILAEYPPGDLNDRSLLLYGQALSRLSDPARARDFFADFIKGLPQSPMAPEVELAVARTFEQEEDWPQAVKLYDRWTVEHADHPSLPKAEFARAWAKYRAGNEADAFGLFANYVERFPTNALAPRAQYWVADYFFRLGGTNYVKAEEAYEKVFKNTNWPLSELSYEAEMMAGRAAYARQGYNDAANYFTSLIGRLTRLNLPSLLLPEVYYALADTYLVAAPPSTNALSGYKEAIRVLDKITREYPMTALAPLAWGRMGSCYFQLATADANNYALALAAYNNALDTNLANVTCRSMAEVGLARVLEAQARQASPTERTNLLNEALRHYRYVVDGKNLGEHEVADPYWVKEAAVGAARLAEEQQQWDVASNLYKRLIDELAPPLRKNWELKLEKLRQLGPRAESVEK
jgi:TolA-binding protein